MMEYDQYDLDQALADIEAQLRSAELEANAFERWQQRFAANKEWLRIMEARVRSLGNRVVCRSGGRWMRIVADRVRGCDVKERCDCQRRWDDFWREVYRGRMDPRVRDHLARILCAADGERGLADAKAGIVAAGYPDYVADKLIDEFCN